MLSSVTQISSLFDLMSAAGVPLIAIVLCLVVVNHFRVSDLRKDFKALYNNFNKHLMNHSHK